MRIRLAGVGQGQRSSWREQTPSLVNTLRKCQLTVRHRGTAERRFFLGVFVWLWWGVCWWVGCGCVCGWCVGVVLRRVWWVGWGGACGVAVWVGPRALLARGVWSVALRGVRCTLAARCLPPGQLPLRPVRPGPPPGAPTTSSLARDRAWSPAGSSVAVQPSADGPPLAHRGRLTPAAPHRYLLLPVRRPARSVPAAPGPAPCCAA